MDERKPEERSDSEGADNKKERNVRLKYRAEYPGDFKFDYKDPVTLYRFIMEGGKIIPSRISKLSNAQQRAMTNEVKKARSLALLPLGTDQFDYYGRPEQISPKPFEF